MDLNSILYAGYLTVAAFGQTVPGTREVVRYAGMQAIHADGNLSLRIVEEGRTESREGLSTHVRTTYRDESYPFFITRHVVRWDDCDVAETWVEIRHDEEGSVRLVRSDSFAAELPGVPKSVDVLTLAGINQTEARVVESRLAPGQTLATSSREGIHNAFESNPAMMVSLGGATESEGEVLGVALEWTGCSAKSVRREFDGATKVFIGVDNQGGPYVLACWIYREFVNWGAQTKATPDGRHDGDRLAQGFAPSELRCRSCVADVFHALSSIDHSRLFASNANLMFGGEDLTPETFAGIFRVFADTGAHLLQPNCNDVATLREAQKHPERYQHLMVKVCGFSARFIALSPEWQEEVIRRHRLR